MSISSGCLAAANAAHDGICPPTKVTTVVVILSALRDEFTSAPL
jgi:hypothetical protein